PNLCCFLFSSRRRHTRSKRDWSSDVCSSDLLVIPLAIALTVYTPWPTNWIIADHPAQLLIGAVIIAGAVVAITAPKRFMAVLMRSEERRVGKGWRWEGSPCGEKCNYSTALQS